MPKELWFDVETTGTNPYKNDIIQFAGMIVESGEVVDQFQIFIQPINWTAISEEALLVNKISREDMKGFQTPRRGYEEIIKFFSKHVNRYDKADKLTPCGYSVDFDVQFLRGLFRNNKDNYLGSYINYRYLDTLYLIRYLERRGRLALRNHKLETICDYFKIKIAAHDALSDIQATFAVQKKIDAMIKLRR